MSNEKQNPATIAEATTVTVACKLPHGLVIRDFVETKHMVDVLGGGKRPEKIFRPVGGRIRVKGPMVPEAFIRLVEVVGGYAITEGIDAKVFARWIDANADAPFVTNELIYGHEDGKRVRAWAKDHASIKSGMEPLDVSMRSKAGAMVYNDERISLAGADNVVDGKLEPTAA